MTTQKNPRAARAQQKRTLTQQTLSAISGLFRKSPKVAAPAANPAPAAKAAAVVDHSADAALLQKLLAMPADDERDIRLSNFAAQAGNADLRWQAAQAVAVWRGGKLCKKTLRRATAVWPSG